ncbi:CDGSH iron-sulfur domain-containing protein [bacterium]|nr:CDGSH iron-sulfur domain-containing protein [bacterium]
MPKERTIRYKGTDLDIYFTIDRCTHYAACLQGSPDVFDTSREPWIIADNDTVDNVAEVIISCPTGALHFKRKDGGPEERAPERNSIKLRKNGPMFVHGDLEIRNHDNSLILTDTRLALCRCGKSTIMPLCDNSHFASYFDKTAEYTKKETAAIPGKGTLVITLTKNGPFSFAGPLELLDPRGEVLFSGEKALICRCGRSESQPFCDGSHTKAGFTTDEQVTLINRDND